MKRPILFAAFLALPSAACGDDAPASDAGNDGPIDASADSAIDAFDPCTDGGFTYEIEVTDGDGARIEQTITVTELGTANMATAAPNGRALLCFEDASATAAVFESENFLPTTNSLLPTIPDQLQASAVSYRVELFTAASADDFATSLGETRDAADTIVFVDVLTVPSGTPVEGATVDLDATYDAAHVADGEGGYSEGKVTLAGGRVAFVNVDATSGDTSVQITPPDGMTCDGPDSASLTGGEISSSLQGCQ